MPLSEEEESKPQEVSRQSVSVEKEIKDAVNAKRLVIGTRQTVRCLKSGSISRVIFASNCPESLKRDLNYYQSLGSVETAGFPKDSVGLGIECGKPFNIVMVGVKK